jgi:hypothetical protein
LIGTTGLESLNYEISFGVCHHLDPSAAAIGRHFLKVHNLYGCAGRAAIQAVENLTREQPARGI